MFSSMPSAMNAPASQTSLISLREASIGDKFQIKAISGANCERLREMGFCESMEVRKVSGGRNLICSVCGTRLALSKDLAEDVMVTPVSG